MEQKEKHTSFLGRGWSFPPTFSALGGTVEMVADEEDIRQSLHILLTTRLGERIMIPDFGCDLTVMNFESITTSFTTYLKDLIKAAILYHEPRIKVEKIEFGTKQTLEGSILISVDYTVRTTNTRTNYVFPYYINEATNL